MDIAILSDLYADDISRRKGIAEAKGMISAKPGSSASTCMDPIAGMDARRRRERGVWSGPKIEARRTKQRGAISLAPTTEATASDSI
jgi:hypothetical protein